MITTDSCRENADERLYKINTHSFGNETKKFLGPSQYNIFTDVSKTEEGVGSGFCIYANNKLQAENLTRLDDNCTVFQAELHAIFDAVTYLKTKVSEWGMKYVKILSNSQSGIQALNTGVFKSRMAWKTSKALNKLAVLCRRSPG